MDLSTIILLAGVFFGLVVGDATLFGDPLQVQIDVPPKVASTGFTEATAEQLFASQVADLGSARAIVPTPSVHMTTRPTLLAVMGKPLHLDDVVVAIQDRIGLGIITVHGALLADPSVRRLDLLTVISMPDEPPVQLKLSQEDGDAAALVQRTADAAMEWVAPYRLAMRQFTGGLKGDAALLTRAQETAGRATGRPWSAGRATEQVMLHNLLAELALLNGDIERAQAEYRLAEAIPGASALAHAFIAFNRSFLDVATGNAAAAARHYQEAAARTDRMDVSEWRVRISTLGGLVAWANSDLAKAEALLRQAIDDLPEDDMAHVYLAQVLDAKGDAAGAAAERGEAAKARQGEIAFPALPQSLFWVDPVRGGLRRRG